MQLANRIKTLIRDVPDFPKPGILFKDITPLLECPEVYREVIKEIVSHFATQQIDAIAAVEARGFLFGMLIAEELGIPFVPVRKQGKLPYEKITEEYALEYGTASVEMHADAIKPGWRVLVHDDLLATGGTAAAAGRLITKSKGTVAGFSFLINLSFLDGEKNLIQQFSCQPHYLIQY